MENEAEIRVQLSKFLRAPFEKLKVFNATGDEQDSERSRDLSEDIESQVDQILPLITEFRQTEGIDGPVTREHIHVVCNQMIREANASISETRRNEITQLNPEERKELLLKLHSNPFADSKTLSRFDTSQLTESPVNSEGAKIFNQILRGRNDYVSKLTLEIEDFAEE